MAGTAYKVIDDGRQRDNWLQLRTQGLGASEIGAVCGVAPGYSSALKVWHEKTTGEPDDADSAVMRFGRRYELLLANDLAEEYGLRFEMEGRLLASKRRPWQTCTLDAKVWDDEHGDEPGLLELKSSLFGEDWRTEGFPAHIRLQTEQQFAVTGFTWGMVGVFNRTNCLQWAHPIEPDMDLRRLIDDEGHTFWHDNVLGGKAPPPDGSKSAKETLAKMFPVASPGAVVGLPTDAAGWAAERAGLREIKKDTVGRLDEIDQRLRMAIGDAEFGRFPDGSGFSLKNSTRTSRATCPECSHEFVTSKSEFRTLRDKANIKG